MEIKKIFEEQLSENIETHKMLSKLLPEIDKSIKIINQKLKLGGKLLFVEMVVQLQMLNT